MRCTAVQISCVSAGDSQVRNAGRECDSYGEYALKQICRKCKSFPAQNLDFLKFPQKCEIHNIQNFEKDGMIYNILEGITRNKADLDLSEISIEVFLQSCSFIEFKLIVSTNSAVFPPYSFRNLHIFCVVTFCMSALRGLILTRAFTLLLTKKFKILLKTFSEKKSDIL